MNLLKEKGLVNDTALYLFALVRNDLGYRLDAVPRAAERVEVSLALLLGHGFNRLGHSVTPLDGASLLVGAANLASAGLLGHVGVLANGDASGLLHNDTPFIRSVLRVLPLIILYHTLSEKSTLFCIFLFCTKSGAARNIFCAICAAPRSIL